MVQRIEIGIFPDLDDFYIGMVYVIIQHLSTERFILLAESDTDIVHRLRRVIASSNTVLVLILIQCQDSPVSSLRVPLGELAWLVRSIVEQEEPKHGTPKFAEARTRMKRCGEFVCPRYAADGAI